MFQESHAFSKAIWNCIKIRSNNQLHCICWRLFVTSKSNKPYTYHLNNKMAAIYYYTQCLSIKLQTIYIPHSQSIPYKLTSEQFTTYTPPSICGPTFSYILMRRLQLYTNTPSWARFSRFIPKIKFRSLGSLRALQDYMSCKKYWSDKFQ